MIHDYPQRRKGTYLIALALSAAISGCSGNSKHHGSGQQAAARMIYSPNGEPLNGGPLGKPTCREAMAKWFERVDTKHDGTISRDKFMADAEAQFRRMDIDGNGYLLSEELERFRQPYRQKSASEEPIAQPSNNKQKQSSGSPHAGGHHGSHSGDSANNSESRNQDNTPSGDTSDPVMSADTNLDFKVTPEEFTAHAEKTFLELDSNHDGALSRDEVSAHCPQKQ